MKFGSWTYDGFKLDLDFYMGLKAVDITDYRVGIRVITFVNNVYTSNVVNYDPSEIFKPKS